VDLDGINADGVSFAYGYTANFDGKDNALTGSGQPADTIALKRINTNTYEGTLKKAGKVVSTTKVTVSDD